MGTMIQRFEPTEETYRGARFKSHHIDLKNAGDVLVLTQPQIITDIHRQYLAAGADIIETDSFNANIISMEEFGLAEFTREINVAAARLAREACDEFTRSQPNQPRFVAGSIGPTKVMLSFNADKPGYRPVTFDTMVESYSEQIRGLIEGGADLLLPETSFDTLNMKSCLYAIENVFAEMGVRLPVMISGTIFTGGRTLTGQSVEAFWTSVSHAPSLTIGLNCALGPKQMRQYVETLAELAPKYISCYPNAGMPDGFGGFDSNPKEVAANLREFVALALRDELGLTVQTNGQFPDLEHDSDARPDPEITREQFDDLVAFLTWLDFPPRTREHPQGEAVFERIGCGSCHTRDVVPGFTEQWRNFGVVDMGPHFAAAGLRDHSASPGERVTASLRGFGDKVRRHASFHSDNSQPDLDASLRYVHQGAALPAAEAYFRLSAADRAALVQFLETL